MKKMIYQLGQTTSSFISNVQMDRRPNLDEVKVFSNIIIHEWVHNSLFKQISILLHSPIIYSELFSEASSRCIVHEWVHDSLFKHKNILLHSAIIYSDAFFRGLFQVSSFNRTKSSNNLVTILIHRIFNQLLYGINF